MKNILVVTKNNSFAETVINKLHNCDYKILTAPDYEQAIYQIENNQIDLILTGLSSAAKNDFSLLTNLDNQQINIPTIVCAHKISEVEADTLDSFAAFNFISETIEQDKLALQEHVKSSLCKGSKGHITGVSLASFLQLIELDRKTCTLRIKQSEKRGVLYFQEGEIIDAVSGQLKGEKAALQIVGWAPVEIDIYENCRKQHPNIDSPLGFLLIEGTRLRDEHKLEKQGQPKEKEPASLEKNQKQKKENTPSPLSISAAEQKLLDRLLEAVDNYEINSMRISKTDGTKLAEKNCTPPLAKLIDDSASSAIDLAATFNYHTPKQILLDHTPTERLLILIGPGAHVGIEINNDLPPSIIAGDLAPIIKRLQF